MKKPIQTIGLLGFCCCLALLLHVNTASAQEPSELADWGPLVVHFDKNKSGLDQGDKSKIRVLLEQYELGKAGRVFVMGYTDSTGAKSYNYKLSRRRAQQVRQAIIATFDLDPHKIIAIGRGAESPVADNSDKKGRASNRRAEIYLSNAVNRELRVQYLQDDPQLETIDALIKQARIKLHQDDLAGALSDLQKARAVGADRYSEWHSLYGIAGFLGGVPLGKIRSHLRIALNLDSGNLEAREFLGRVEARERVAAGQVTAGMGRSAGDAIAVLSMGQQEEYLMLFGVEPLYRHELEGTALDVWECRDRLQAPVVYYFDRSRVYDWQFDAGRPEPASSPGPAPSGARMQPIGAVPAEPAGPEAPQGTAMRRIWQSRLFR